MKKIKILCMALAMVVITSCELDLLDNPNAVTPASADNNFIANRLQIDFAGFFHTASGFGQQMTRMINVGGNTYETAYTAVTFNGIWNNAYANILVDADALIERAEAVGLTTHAGIAHVFKAYVLMTLVDYFGDVPYSDALNPNEFNPSRDGGATIYAAALSSLDAAIANFETAPLSNPNDLYYGASRANWRKLAKSLKLKYHLNQKLLNQSGATTAINALIAEDDFISASAENFRFRYSREPANPDSRHPWFVNNYIGGANQYQSNYYMWHLTEAKGFDDPRARYYFYRQVGVNPTDINQLRCINEFAPNHYIDAGVTFCLPGDRGYWGRDHLDNQGIPPDGFSRTAPGVYPAGGRFDDNSFAPTNSPNLGNQGAGIQPIMMRASVQFMLAEAAVTLGTTGDAATYLEEGIRASLADVRAYALTGLQASTITAFTTNAAYNTLTNTYVNYVMDEYAAAGSNTDRMRIIAREYWLSLYGNGVEAYNLYRRTGQPDGMQPGLNPIFGDFPRSFLYPADHVNRNRNAEQKPSIRQRVFWDTNPEGNAFID
jgi:hypothetical protein